MTATLRLLSPRTLTFHLTIYPMRLSDCFVNVARNGRADSKEYKAWKIQSDWCVKTALRGWLKPDAPLFTGPCAIIITVKKPDNRHRDLDNLNKALIDLVQRNGIVKNDSQFHKITIQWGKEIMPHPVHYLIEEMI